MLHHRWYNGTSNIIILASAALAPERTDVSSKWLKRWNLQPTALRRLLFRFVRIYSQESGTHSANQEACTRFQAQWPRTLSEGPFRPACYGVNQLSIQQPHLDDRDPLEIELDAVHRRRTRSIDEVGSPCRLCRVLVKMSVQIRLLIFHSRSSFGKLLSLPFLPLSPTTHGYVLL